MKPAIGDASLTHLPHIARDAIAAHLERRARAPRAAHRPVHGASGVFVTLTTKHDGALRGCIGHMRLSSPTFEDEVADTAVSAASQDPRFPPVTRDELDGLDVEISVLGAEERIDDARMLDPRRYGVVVRSFGRTGVLLPDLEGVDDVTTQLDIACRKAGIHPDEPMQISRFEVVKVGERHARDGGTHERA